LASTAPDLDEGRSTEGQRWVSTWKNEGWKHTWLRSRNKYASILPNPRWNATGSIQCHLPTGTVFWPSC
jgi:hypothetical protein